MTTSFEVFKELVHLKSQEKQFFASTAREIKKCHDIKFLPKFVITEIVFVSSGSPKHTIKFLGKIGI